MDNGLETIVEIVLLLFFLGLMLVPFLAFFIYVFFQNSKRKNIRQRAQTQYGQLIGSGGALPVRYCSERRFRNWFKIFPWEGAGILVPAQGVVTFVGENLNGTPLNFQFARDNSVLQWMGKCPWPNGAVSWFSIDNQGQKHYFTSETGPFVFGSNNSTRQAFDQSQRSFTS
ncbi:MAG TPA: hypothetical protein VI306_25260 [Pyrinomonadaceae bacterium]